MKHVFWLIPGVLAGRPGPDNEPWDLAELREAGIAAVLSVNDGQLCHPEEFPKQDLVYGCVPLSPNAPPRPGDLEHCRRALPEAFAFVTRIAGSGGATLVHCFSGKDRTGLFMAYYLVRSKGLSPEGAIAAVRRARPIAFTAPGWEDFAREVLAGV